MKIPEQSDDEHARAKLFLERWIWVWPLLGAAGFAAEFMQIGHGSYAPLRVQNEWMFNVAWSMALGGIPTMYAAIRLRSWICVLAATLMLALCVVAIGFSIISWGLL